MLHIIQELDPYIGMGGLKNWDPKLNSLQLKKNQVFPNQYINYSSQNSIIM